MRGYNPGYLEASLVMQAGMVTVGDTMVVIWDAVAPSFPVAIGPSI